MRTQSLKRQGGSSMIEILVSVAVLSIGILALVGLQAKSIASASDAKFRVEATNFADQIIGVMWTDRTSLPSYASFSAPSAAQWKTQVMAAIPGAVAPTIEVSGAAGASLVSVTIGWAPPGLASGAPAHQVVVQTRIDNP